jgi:diaminohydroxyphosphoribosylaminopyrimidine deaminase/5-amino-6-(5-phosphoribosylamino)uracil reductase
MAWETILRIKETVKKNTSDREFLIIPSTISTIKSTSGLDGESCTIRLQFKEDTIENDNADIIIECYKPFLSKLKYNQAISLPDRHLLEMYVPYAVLPYFAMQFHKTFVVSHFAQTIDGRIASTEGDSKWIGNQENLVHAHRMRALLDGIIIGSRTLSSDNPKLTVRHVTGKDPRKILIGGDRLDLTTFNIGHEEFISISQNPGSKGLKYKFEKKRNLYNSKEILNALFELGIYSVYIEGGAITTTTFLIQNSIDQIQAHFAPIILGSGTTGFNFDGVKYLEEAIYFKSFRYVPIGDQMMFIGEL